MNSALVACMCGIRCDKYSIRAFRDARSASKRSHASMAKLGVSLDIHTAVTGREPGGKHVRVLVHHYLHDGFVQ
jgi:hypothetical protein